MKYSVLLFSLLAVLTSLGSFAADQNDALSLEQLKSRFEVKGEVFYLTPDGKRLLRKGGEWRLWRPRVLQGKAQIESQWVSRSAENGGFALRHVWTLQEDGSIKVFIEEYGKAEAVIKPGGEPDKKLSELLKKDERVLTDFAPITWISARSHAGHRLLIRFTPNVSEEPSPKNLTELPIAGSQIMITDNEGKLWTQRNTVNGKYVGFVTHQGALFLSYYPFPGAGELGVAFGNSIELKLGGKRTATLTSHSAFLPEDVRAKVYGIYRPEQKTWHLSWAEVFVSNQEGQFSEMIKPVILKTPISK